MESFIKIKVDTVNLQSKVCAAVLSLSPLKFNFKLSLNPQSELNPKLSDCQARSTHYRKVWYGLGGGKGLPNCLRLL